MSQPFREDLFLRLILQYNFNLLLFSWQRILSLFQDRLSLSFLSVRNDYALLRPIYLNLIEGPSPLQTIQLQDELRKCIFPPWMCYFSLLH